MVKIDPTGTQWTFGEISVKANCGPDRLCIVRGLAQDECSHPCQKNPCKYTYDIGLVDSATEGYVACCCGKAYACVTPGIDNDPSVKYCILKHEEEHVKTNRNCKNIRESGCRGRGPADGWFDTDVHNDECRAHNVELKCLDEALFKYGCKVGSAPHFKGAPNRRKCFRLYQALQGTCDSAREYCRKSGTPVPICDKWKLS